MTSKMKKIEGHDKCLDVAARMHTHRDALAVALMKVMLFCQLSPALHRYVRATLDIHCPGWQAKFKDLLGE